MSVRHYKGYEIEINDDVKWKVASKALRGGPGEQMEFVEDHLIKSIKQDGVVLDMDELSMREVLDIIEHSLQAFTETRTA